MRAPLLVFAAAFLFLGVLFFLIGGRSLLDGWRYRQAVRTEAAAIATAVRAATDTSGTAYEITYRAVVDGQTYDRTQVVPVHLWERAGTGASVPVEFLPGRPDTVRATIDDAAATRQSVIFTAIGSLMLLVGVGTAARAVRGQPAAADEPAAPIAIPRPESSYWPRARQSVAFWAGAIFVIVATPLLAVALLQAFEEWRFFRSGVSTDGMILTKEIKSGRRSRSNTYEATYRVMVPEGAFESRAQLPYDVWSNLRERQSVEVWYLPERPGASRLDGSRSWMAPAIMGLVASLFLPVGLTFLRRSIRQARLEWRLERRGAAAKGVIVEISDRHLKINEVRQFRLRYEYDDFQARRHTATHDMPEDEAQLWNVGDVGSVRYDPGRPADSIWLGR